MFFRLEVLKYQNLAVLYKPLGTGVNRQAKTDNVRVVPFPNFGIDSSFLCCSQKTFMCGVTLSPPSAKIAKISFSMVLSVGMLFLSIYLSISAIQPSSSLQTNLCFWTVATNLSLLEPDRGALLLSCSTVRLALLSLILPRIFPASCNLNTKCHRKATHSFQIGWKYEPEMVNYPLHNAFFQWVLYVS